MRASRIWLRRAVTSYGECSCLHRFSCATARADRRAWFRSCVARCLGTLHGTLRPEIQHQAHQMQRQIPARSGFLLSEAFFGCRCLRSGKKAVRKAPPAAGPSSSQLVSHKSTAGTRARPRRAQALDVHCVLDPSNPSNPSDGAPLDQLCPSMRGCLRLRATVDARTTTTKDATTSNDRSRGRTGHPVARQAQPATARPRTERPKRDDGPTLVPVRSGSLHARFHPSPQHLRT